MIIIIKFSPPSSPRGGVTAYTCTSSAATSTCAAAAAAAEDRAAAGRCLYEPGVSMVCCRASAAAALDALACLNHGNDILRRCDLSAAATWVSVRRDAVAAPVVGRCGGSSDGILDDGGTFVTPATTTAAVDTSARRPPPELGASIDQSGSPSTGGVHRLDACSLLDRSPPPPPPRCLLRCASARMCTCMRGVRGVRSERTWRACVYGPGT